MYKSIVKLINMKKLYLIISFGVSLLLPPNVLGQMGARMPPVDYDEGAFRNPSDGWITLLWAIILFVGPVLIAKNKDGDDAGIEYWKWWFITLVGSFTILLFFKTPLASLFSSIAILIYGFINNKNTEVKNNTPPAALKHKNERVEPKKFNETSVTINQPRIKGKIWSVVGNKIYNKLTNKSYTYSIMKSGLAVGFVNSKSNPHLEMVNISSIDVIKFNNGMAYVECPNCSAVNKVFQSDELVISCSSCQFSWKQDMKIPD